MNTDAMKEAAGKYFALGLSIIPLLLDKRPAIKWTPYQKKRPTYSEIKEWFGNGSCPPAMAIVTGEISGLVVVDIDEEEGFEAIKQFFPLDIQTPVCRTPSGGAHYYFKHPGFSIGNNARVIPGCDFRGDGGYIITCPSHCEYYKSVKGEKEKKFIKGDYVWERSILDTDPAPLPQLYIKHVFSSNSFNSFSLYRDSTNQTFPQFDNVQQVLQSSTNESMWEVGKRDESLFHVANCLVKGGMPKPEIYQVLRLIMNSWGEDDIKWVSTKIESAIARSSRRERNLAQEVLEWVDSTNGNFYSTDIDKFLHCSTLQEKKNVSIILKRLSMQEPPIIEKVPGKNGHWRKVENTLEIIDWQNAPDEEYPISLPLDLHDLCKIYPGNIIVLAGASNTGKTSFMLETIRLNQDKHKVVYFNSEMGATELRLRLSMFDQPLSSWKFKAIERSSNFADVVEPDALNIIDFMEVYDDFWKIGGWIRDVHEKLKSGVAIIAIQKKSSTTQTKQRYGRGGELSLEKPRLYLAMDRGKIEIVKAKIWREHERNPNGLVRNFKLIGGWEFRPSNEWHRTEEEKYHNDNFIPE